MTHSSLSNPEQHSRIAFLFPGQASQHVRMAQDLYDRSPAYAEAFDECLDLFKAAGVPLRRWWRDGDEDQLSSPRAALPLTFAVEHALAEAWQSWGITPDAVLGVSIGEMAAGAVAGVFTLPDAVAAIAVRSQAVQDLPPGGQIAVSASREEVAPLLPDGAWIAVIISPRQVVVAGLPGPLADAAATLARAGLACYPVLTTHAAHGEYAAPAVPILDQALRRLRLAPPAIDFYSADTGQLVSVDEATDPGFWSRQLIRPVMFADALDALTSEAGRLLIIEVGPGQTLTKVARRHPTVVARRHRVLPTLAHNPVAPLAQARSALAAVEAVSAAGHAINWPAVKNLLDVDPVSGAPSDRARRMVAPALAPAITEDVATPTSFGRSDRRPEATDSALPTESAGSGSTVDRLRRLWSTALGEDDIAPSADFFELGGNSLTAVELMVKVAGEFHVEVELVVLFEHPTLEGFAKQLDALAEPIDRRGR
jgi:acyl transferase domain-containing protein